MPIASFASDTRPGVSPAAAPYLPGVCNIGPAEIARRRRVGHVGLVVSIALLVALVALGVPPWVRLLVALPATLAAAGYLQAWLRFCAGFGFLGVINFGEVGRVDEVSDPASRARDRTRALQIGLASLAIGAAVGLAAVLLPL